MSGRPLLRSSVLLLAIVLPSSCGDDGSDLDAEVRVLVDAEQGGVVESADGRFRLEIPAGALAEDTEITLARLPADAWSAEVAALEPVGDVYALGPHGLRFAVPARMEQELDHDDPDAFPLLAGASRSADGELSMLGSPFTYYDVASRTAIFTAEVHHFSDEFVTAELQPLLVHDAADFDQRSKQARLVLELERPSDEPYKHTGSVWNTKVRLRNTGELGLELTRVRTKAQASFAVEVFDDRALDADGAGWSLIPSGITQDLGHVRWICWGAGLGAAAVRFQAELTGEVAKRLAFGAMIVDPYECVYVPIDDPPPPDTSTGGETDFGGGSSIGDTGEWSTSDTGGGETSTGGSETTGDGETTGGETTDDGETTGGVEPGPWQECIGLPVEACEPCCIDLADTIEQLEACVVQCG